ncbi:Piso0_005847 [Millerozyma farinosa CBS 7064]|uniref:Piso0_005847 protein n=1 Tax=Pichia sorbitophila (strain ATCC MYA-4447 / BCRC 22081 / CBS 7064 / NBRC 10061 / NRRL Y-12695) TaxID=559304 RepID=G8Y330_PICSO|nr:Piso0_005847 [Millerozyma farinosa CBS 7064]
MTKDLTTDRLAVHITIFVTDYMVDRPGMSMQPSFQYDPFREKQLRLEEKTKRPLKHFKNRALQSDIFPCDTYFTNLVLRSKVRLNELHVRKILGLDEQDEIQEKIYQSIRKQILYAAQELKRLCGFSDLTEMPMTDLRCLCYEIALVFKGIFFVPVKTKTIISSDDMSQEVHYPTSFVPASTLPSNRTASTNAYNSQHQELTAPRIHHSSEVSQSNSIEIIQYISKFREMWIVVLLLRQEYSNISMGYLC